MPRTNLAPAGDDGHLSIYDPFAKREPSALRGNARPAETASECDGKARLAAATPRRDNAAQLV